jgi:uncharacterized protein (DUF305 family)
MDGFRSLFAVLAVVTLLVAGVGFTSTAIQAGSMMSGDASNGEGPGSMMGDGAGPMMESGDASDPRTRDPFDEEQPFDLQFIDQMTVHHEGAIMSSQMMISDSKRPELRQLAEDIQQGQSEQIEQMQGWRDDWYPDAAQTSGMPAGMMGDGNMGDRMMGDGSMQGMMGGDATDEMFLRMMIPHHRMAVDMSEMALYKAEHPALEDLAHTIIDEQTAEIELMEGYLEEIVAAKKG